MNFPMSSIYPTRHYAILRRQVQRCAPILSVVCRTSLTIVAAVLFAAPALAQQQPPLEPTVPAEPAPPPATQPAAPAPIPADAEPFLARVIEVRGDAQHAPFGSDEWQTCAEGDEYPQNTLIRTGIRSAVKLQLGEQPPYSAMIVEAASKTLLSELYTTTVSKRVRVGVGYGGVRAGVAEGGLQSDFTVDSPVATLSKRGTWNFGLFYERATNRFEVFVLEQGFVEALNKVTDVRRELVAGELVTQVMRRWLDESQIQRNVAVADLWGYGDVDVVFNRLRESGLGIVDLANGQRPLLDLQPDYAQVEFGRLARQGLLTAAPLALVAVASLRPNELITLRQEGFFGTGRGDQLIDVLIERNNVLARRGLASPGRYQFRRSVLEGWLQAREAGRR